MVKHRIRAARHYQRRDDPLRLVAERGKPAVHAAIVRALKTFKAAIPRAKVAELIAARDFAAAADAVNIATLKHDLRAPFAALAEIHKAGALRGQTQINEVMKGGRARVRKDTAPMSGGQERPDRFAFDLYTQDVLDELAAYQDEFIGALSDDVRQTIFDAIVEGVKEGAEPADVATRIRDVIGLSDRQATAVENYRAALESNVGGALDYALRDDAGDADVIGALSAGNPLDQDRIDELVDSYIERSLDYRADMIAETESNRAANMGLQASYAQAIDNDVFPAEAVKQYWLIALDEKTCDVCQGIADDYPDGIAIGEAFDSDDGPVDAPPVHPNCRCTIEVRIDLDLVPAADSGGEDDGG